MPQLEIVFIFYPWETIGGAITRTVNLIKALSKHYRINFLILPPRRLTVLASLMKMLSDLERKNLIKVYIIPTKISKLRVEEFDFNMFAKTLVSIYKFLPKRSQKPKYRFVLYSRHPLYLMFASSLAGKPLGIPSITEIHHHIYAGYRNAVLRFLLKILEWLTLNISTLIVVNSEVFYNELRNGALKLHPEKLVLIRNCINLEELTYLTKKETNLGLTEKFDGDLIGFVGSLKPEEDIITLLKAFKTVQQSRSNTYLVIIGGGRAVELYKQMVKILGLEERVIFLGEKSHEEAIKIMKKLKIFIALRGRNPRTEMAAPLKIVEALALGIPVIATDLPSIREVVQDAAILVPPGDYKAVAEAILNLLNEPALRQALVEKGIRRIVNLNCENAILPLLQALGVIANASQKETELIKEDPSMQIHKTTTFC
ncbi:MAG: glycosyltransferase family 4 protein [Thermosphaera sp.]